MDSFQVIDSQSKQNRVQEEPPSQIFVEPDQLIKRDDGADAGFFLTGVNVQNKDIEQYAVATA